MVEIKEIYKRIKKIYNIYFLKADLLLSIAISLTVILVLRSIWSYDMTEQWLSTNKNTIYSLIATISGTLLGFVITGVSIIIAFSGTSSEKYQFLRKNKVYPQVFKIFFSTIKYLAISTVLPVVGIIIDESWKTPSFISRYLHIESLDILIFYSVIIVVSASVSRIYRCLWILENIVELIISDEVKS